MSENNNLSLFLSSSQQEEAIKLKLSVFFTAWGSGILSVGVGCSKKPPRAKDLTEPRRDQSVCAALDFRRRSPDPWRQERKEAAAVRRMRCGSLM